MTPNDLSRLEFDAMLVVAPKVARAGDGDGWLFKANERAVKSLPSDERRRAERLRGYRSNGDGTATTLWPHQLLLVTHASSVTHRRSMYACALMFKREFGYDFAQYAYQGRDVDDQSRGFLFIDEADMLHERVAGAASFYWREWDNHPPCWGLQWIWLHPFRRRRGQLTRSWPFFRDYFGDFVPEPPLSVAMSSFLEKYKAASGGVNHEARR